MPRTRQRSSNGNVPNGHGIVGKSAAIRATIASACRVAPTTLNVILQGESGTGKELLAKLIHKQSPRLRKRLLPINCSAIPEGLLEAELFGHQKGAFNNATETKIGLLEAADGGTVFLDEIGDMPLALQAKLLRVLQDGVLRRVRGTRDILVDLRVVAATHRNLLAMVKKGTFRLDLYHRLAGYPIAVPPLRERDRDVVLIARHFLEGWKEQGRRVRLGRDAEQQLMACPWPGNVRELENVIDRAVVDCQGGRISADDVISAVAVPVEPLHVVSSAEDPQQAIVSLLAEQGPQSISAIRDHVQQSKTNVARHLLSPAPT